MENWTPKYYMHIGQTGLEAAGGMDLQGGMEKKGCSSSPGNFIL